MKYTPSLFRSFMVKHYQRLWRSEKTVAHSPEEMFGFRAEDVEQIHFKKQGVPVEGTWYRLKDGRVIDQYGLPSEPDPYYYDTTTH